MDRFAQWLGGARLHRRAADELCAERIAWLAGALEVETCHGVFELRAVEDLEHHIGCNEHGVHGVGVKAVPERQQLCVAKAAGSAADGVVADCERLGGVAVAVAVYDDIDSVLKMHAHDLIADLAQHDRKQVKALEADSLVGCDEHSAALFQAYKVISGTDLGLRDECALADEAQCLVVLGSGRVDGAVVHALKASDRCGDGRQDIALLHAGLYASGDILGEQNGRLGGGEKLLDDIAACATDLNIETLELALISVKTLKACALIVF